MLRAMVRAVKSILLPPVVWGLSAVAAFAAPAGQALVIGIDAYDEIAPLMNPGEDARRTAASLAALGFEVETLRDGTAAQLAESLAAFHRRSAGAEVALIYFAGHGMQIEGTNFLLPRDADPDDLPGSALNMERFLAAFGEGVGSRLLIVDACRNNPLATRSLAATTRGLARLNHSVEDLTVLFSAQPGHVALDGAGRNSPFAVALNETLTRHPSIKLTDALVDITSQVRSQTSGRQTPYFEGSLSAHVVFTRTVASGPATLASVAPACAPVTPVRVEEQADGFFEASGDAAGLRIETRAGDRLEICRRADGVSVRGAYAASFGCDQIRDAGNEGVGYYYREADGVEGHIWLHVDLTAVSPELEVGVYRGGEENLWMTTGWAMCPPG